MAYKRYTNWTCTINNYNEEEDINEIYLCEKEIQYCLFYHEEGKKKHTEHLQGFIVWKLDHRKRFTEMKKLFSRMHFKPMNGTIEQNEDYVDKDEELIIKIGEKPIGQGKRTDIYAVKAFIEKQPSVRALLNSDIKLNTQTIRMAEILCKYVEPVRNFKPEVYWIWGETGIGKTRLVYDNFEMNEIYKKTTNSGKWWDGYDGHKIVILDDLRPSDYRYHELLTLLDRYPYQVEIKGGFRQLLATIIIITTDRHPNKFYQQDVVGDLRQLTRRFTAVIELTDANSLLPFDQLKNWPQDGKGNTNLPVSIDYDIDDI